MQRLLSFFLAVCVLGTGCGQPDSSWDRVPVTGRVTINDQPFSGGLSFLPDANVSGPAAGTDGQDGQYQFSKQDGPVAGSHTVMLMPTAGSLLDGEQLEMVVLVPDEPPFKVDLAIRIDSSVMSTQASNSGANSQGGSTASGQISAAGINAQTGSPGGGAVGVGGPSESPGNLDEEKKTDESSERMPTRGPAGKGK